MQNIKTLKDLLKLKTGKALNIKYPIKLCDEAGNKIYFEDSDGFWGKYEFDEKGNQTYYENSNGYWSKYEFDGKGNQTYFEDSDKFWYKQEFDEEGKRIYQENLYGYIYYK